MPKNILLIELGTPKNLDELLKIADGCSEGVFPIPMSRSSLIRSLRGLIKSGLIHEISPNKYSLSQKGEMERRKLFATLISSFEPILKALAKRFDLSKPFDESLLPLYDELFKTIKESVVTHKICYKSLVNALSEVYPEVAIKSLFALALAAVAKRNKDLDLLKDLIVTVSLTF
ncbi:hypothetical protein IPA_05830 [Ignicoccus pacificus DSM 13166]|uniref:Uncharacterized protein n=1 Tax=Ignicoccus pacificus DSM 13166 TaxID=940294 RepID=A0A977KBE4_9CREN|nr:hypothetical protein IPA_05830 [Ignicoccus pacificus DSM 13166]